MSEIHATIENRRPRPTLEINFTSPDATPPPEVLFFDMVALSHPDTLQEQLASWPPEIAPPEDEQASETQATVYEAVAGVLAASSFGGTIDYDQATWGAVMNDDTYLERASIMGRPNQQRRDEENNKLRAHTAVRGLAIYARRLQKYNEQNAVRQNVA